ncbi:hypothetical protein BUALT_Bualt12G0055600 [Buddleja alternifolia]|uniref:F-box protein At3g26010-like beta-propeller domain-containing protein n=1 Tax=Buddleja alternifolia TaxID=168488 RepID=A0AAV6WVL2_9LAMI|nr:hypothetical protein BUALT_Bualt12G0055600 [Buddleja alternifolia]
MQSCNGLLLLECKNSRYGQESYYVYNPITKQYRNLLIKRPFAGLCLAFDPLKSPHYKATCFTNDDQRVGSEYQFSIDVYESETHTWKHCAKLRINILQFHNGIYWNDGIYFIRPGGKSFCFYLRGIEDNVAQRIDKPPKVCSRGKRRGYAMESNGHLHFISVSLQPHKNSLSVFELNKDDRSWFMKYRVDLRPIAAMFDENYDLVYNVLGIIRGDREEDSTMMFHEPGKIILYRFYDKSFEVLVNFRREDYYEEGRFQYGFNDSFQFIETLVPV